MKKPKLFYAILFLIVITCFVSCKTDNLVLPMYQSSHLDAIAKLPIYQKIEPGEMQKWFEENLHSFAVKPQWDKPIQTIHNGSHIIEVTLGEDGALFFIKTNGLLNVYACRWQDKEPGAASFVGSILYYSFLTNKMRVVVYNKNGLVRNNNHDVPFPKEGMITALMLPDFWAQINAITNARQSLNKK